MQRFWRISPTNEDFLLKKWPLIVQFTEGEDGEGEDAGVDPTAGLGTFQSTMAPGMTGGAGARMTRGMPPPPVVPVRGGAGGGTGGATGVGAGTDAAMQAQWAQHLDLMAPGTKKAPDERCDFRWIFD